MGEIQVKINNATEHAISLIKQGTDVNSAVKKATEELNKEATQRVIENVNVERWLSFLKASNDRTKEYDIADPKKIILQEADENMSKESLNKVASISNSFYMQKESQSDIEKYASHHEPNISQLQLCKQAARRKELEKHFDQTLLDAREHYIKKASFLMDLTMEKIGKDHKAAKKYFDDIYSKLGGQSLSMVRTFAKKLGFDYTPTIKKLVKKSAALDAAERTFEALKTLHGLTKQSFFGPSVANEAIKLVMKAQGKIRENKAKNDDSLSEGDQVALALKHKRIFEDLVANDEILSQRNPSTLAKMYNSMIGIAPNIAADPEIVKAHLREASGYSVFGPYEAKTIADLQKAVDPDRDRNKGK